MCPCILTAEFMTRLGALQAARMHIDKGAPWTTRDYFVHLDEEDQFFRPFLVEVFPLLLAVYDDDHRQFRAELAAVGRIVSEERWKAHAALEDWATARLVEMGY